MEIAQIPLHNQLNTPAVLDYTLSPDELWTFWNERNKEAL